MTRTELVTDLIDSAKAKLLDYWGKLPPQTGMRLDGIEAELGALKELLEQRLWEVVLSALSEQAEQLGGVCSSCARRCTREPQPLAVVVRGRTVQVPVVYYYCRRCHRGQAPLRQWLGVHDGSHSGGFARALVSLCLLRSFGDGAKEMKEQQGQEVDRTRAERVTYQVAAEARQYLDEKTKQWLAQAGCSELPRQGVEQLTLTADGGAVPVGTLVRLTRQEATEFTVKRHLPKGTRQQTKREVRLISVHRPQVLTERVVDIHVAPQDHPAAGGKTSGAGATTRTSRTSTCAGRASSRPRPSAARSGPGVRPLPRPTDPTLRPASGFVRSPGSAVSIAASLNHGSPRSQPREACRRHRSHPAPLSSGPGTGCCGILGGMAARVPGESGRARKGRQLLVRLGQQGAALRRRADELGPAAGVSLGVGLGFATGAALLWRGDMVGLVAAGLCLGGAAALGLSAQPLTDLTFLPDGAPSPTSIKLPALVEPLAMKELDGGTFLMGSAPEEDPGHHESEAPVHSVQVSPYAMALHPVTQRLYREVTGSLPKLTFEGDELPITDVNWFDAARFCNLLSEKVGLRPCYQFTVDGETVSWDRSANGYRLPTEAEWEYAARAGTRTPWSCPEDQLGEHAWYSENSQNQVQPVGKKKANPFGLFDMHGNVYEWCWDWYGSYPRSPVRLGSLPDEASTAIEPSLDPLGPLTGDSRLLRGGSFVYGPRFLRSSDRSWNEPAFRGRDVGFRCVRGSRRSFDPSSS